MADKQAYVRKLNELIQAQVRGQTAVVRNSMALLAELRRELIASLAAVEGSAFSSYRLGELLANVDRLLAQYALQQTAVLGAAVAQQYDLGQRTEYEPLLAAGARAGFYAPNQVQVGILQGFSADLVKGLSENLLKNLNTQIRMAALGQQSPFDVQKTVTRLLGFTPRGKLLNTGVAYEAERIIRTELSRVFNAGHYTQQLTTFTAVPDLAKRWLATGDFRTRETHLRAHAETMQNPIPIKEPFVVGNSRLLYPNDPAGEAKETIMCRCRSQTIHPDIGVIPSPLDDGIVAELQRRDIAIKKQAPAAAVAPTAVSDPITALAETERRIINQRFESAFVVDGDGRPVLFKNGNRNSVSFTLEETNQFAGAYLTHNHPSGSAFSDADILLTHAYRVKAVRAVGVNRKGEQIAYTFRVDDDAFYDIPQNMLGYILDNARNKAKQAVDSWLFAPGSPVTAERIHEANYRVSHLAMKELASTINGRYETPVVLYKRERFK